jgi:uncharacterized protein (DUF433 family)
VVILVGIDWKEAKMAAANTALSQDTDTAMLEAMVEPEPGSGRDKARLKDYGTPVWALIAELQANDWDIAEVARAYRVPETAVRAAIHYYEGNKPFIDAFLLLNSDANDF